jgi:hypothetical protein
LGYCERFQNLLEECWLAILSFLAPRGPPLPNQIILAFIAAIKLGFQDRTEPEIVTNSGICWDEWAELASNTLTGCSSVSLRLSSISALVSSLLLSVWKAGSKAGDWESRLEQRCSFEGGDGNKAIDSSGMSRYCKSAFGGGESDPGITSGSAGAARYSRLSKPAADVLSVGGWLQVKVWFFMAFGFSSAYCDLDELSCASGDSRKPGSSISGEQDASKKQT